MAEALAIRRAVWAMPEPVDPASGQDQAAAFRRLADALEPLAQKT